MDINFIVNITARAWAIPILAEMHNGIAGRQAPLLAATGATRTAFAQSMGHLIDMNLLERNPGYGHPLRPEFRLTELGKNAARLAHTIQAAANGQGHDILRRSWTVPILTALHQPTRFNDIKRTLPQISDRALSQSLRGLENTRWVHRTVDSAARPPIPHYITVNIGRKISRATCQSMANWQSQ